MAEWELSKENIQPLRQGRKVSAMLDPASDAKKISEEKQWEFSQLFQNQFMLPNANTIQTLQYTCYTINLIYLFRSFSFA